MSMTRRRFIHSGAALTGAAQIAKASPNGKITVGMIGTGARSQELMQVILKLPQEAEIVGVVDAYLMRRRYDIWESPSLSRGRATV